MSSTPWRVQQRFFYNSLIRVAEAHRRGQDHGVRRRSQNGVGRIDLDPGSPEIQRQGLSSAKLIAQYALKDKGIWTFMACGSSSVRGSAIEALSRESHSDRLLRHLAVIAPDAAHCAGQTQPELARVAPARCAHQ
jgi:hypothetical protein